MYTVRRRRVFRNLTLTASFSAFLLIDEIPGWKAVGHPRRN
jgi:hypothetical protein